MTAKGGIRWGIGLILTGLERLVLRHCTHITTSETGLDKIVEGGVMTILPKAAPSSYLQ